MDRPPGGEYRRGVVSLGLHADGRSSGGVDRDPPRTASRRAHRAGGVGLGRAQSLGAAARPRAQWTWAEYSTHSGYAWAVRAGELRADGRAARAGGLRRGARTGARPTPTPHELRGVLGLDARSLACAPRCGPR